MASGPITSWEMDGETVSDFIFLDFKITADGDILVAKFRLKLKKVGKTTRIFRYD